MPIRYLPLPVDAIVVTKVFVGSKRVTSHKFKAFLNGDGLSSSARGFILAAVQSSAGARWESALCTVEAKAGSCATVNVASALCPIPTFAWHVFEGLA